MRKTLYRKYRPTSLDQVVGQSHITDTLSQAIKKGNFAHAYLFIGPRGTGKTSVARIFAHAINDFKYEIEDDYVDIIEIDAASNTGVDNIRELREKAVIAPSVGKYKVYIIDEIHMLSNSAFNALLKTLEEPPEHVVFLMATTDPQKIPITITSRAQTFTFSLANTQTMTDHLVDVAKQEKIDISPEALEIIVRRGGGSFRDSLSILDQVATALPAPITAEAIEQALGLPQGERINQLLDTYRTADLSAISEQLQSILATGVKPETIAAELVTEIIAHPEPPLLPLLEQLPSVSAPFATAKLLLALSPAFTPQTAVTPTSSPKTPSGASQSLKTATPLPNPAPKTSKKPSAPPETTPAPTPETTPEPTTPSTSNTTPNNFSWENFIASLQTDHSGLCNQLQKVDHELIGQTLHLYPHQAFSRNILRTPGNKQLLASAAPDLEIIVHDLNDRPVKKDPAIDQISAIMGTVQEVKNGRATAPF